MEQALSELWLADSQPEHTSGPATLHGIPDSRAWFSGFCSMTSTNSCCLMSPILLMSSPWLPQWFPSQAT